MRNSIAMVACLSLITLASGTLLGWLHGATKGRIEEQILKNKKLPAVKKVLPGATNDLLKTRVTVQVKQKGKKKKLKKTIFVGRKKDGKIFAVALEGRGKGYGGDLGFMLGLDIKTGKITGIGLTDHKETPGVGSKSGDAAFTKQFKGLGKGAKIRVKKDGGQIDAVSGATISSRAACHAVGQAMGFYFAHKKKIMKALKAGGKKQ